MPLPAVPFDPCQIVTGRASSMSLVRYRTNDYSVPTAYAHQEVVIKGYVDRVAVICRGEQIAVHPRSYEREDFIANPLHYLAHCQSKCTQPHLSASHRNHGFAESSNSANWQTRRPYKFDIFCASCICSGSTLVRKPSDRVSLSDVSKQRHEPIIHVQLLVAVEQRVARVIGCEIEGHLLITAKHDDILDHAGCRLAVDLGQLEAVAVKMERVNVIARVTEFEPVAVPPLQCVDGLHRLHRKSLPVQRPPVEAAERRVVLLDRHHDRFVGCWPAGARFTKIRIVPAEGPGLDPCRLARMSGIFDDDAHAVAAIVVGKIAHHPDPGMRHLDDRRNALRRPDPQRRNFGLRRHRVTIERRDSEEARRCAG